MGGIENPSKHPVYARALEEWDSPELGSYSYCMDCKVIHRMPEGCGTSCKELTEKEQNDN